MEIMSINQLTNLNRKQVLGGKSPEHDAILIRREDPQKRKSLTRGSFERGTIAVTSK